MTHRTGTLLGTGALLTLAAALGGCTDSSPSGVDDGSGVHRTVDGFILRREASPEDALPGTGRFSLRPADGEQTDDRVVAYFVSRLRTSSGRSVDEEALVPGRRVRVWTHAPFFNYSVSADSVIIFD